MDAEGGFNITEPKPSPDKIMRSTVVGIGGGEGNVEVDPFGWTEVGAQYVGIIQSLIVTCKMHGINPYVYLVDVLQRVAIHPAKDVHELTPRLWKDKYGQNPMVSDLAD
jgi:hypothetical protein